MQIQPQGIRKIVIAGGGSAGWMTAAALAKVLGTRTYEIQLIESANIGTVSVGEATIPGIREFNAILDIDENDFVRSTQGSFKLGIEFLDWRHKDHSYMHPFGPYGVTLNGVPFHHYYLQQEQLNNAKPLQDYCLEWSAAKRGLFSRPVANARNPLVGIKYAFHFDALLYAEYLQKLAVKWGVRHVQDDIEKVHLCQQKGNIKALTLAKHGTIEGDLFIDCTGFKGLLIEQALHCGYEDWSHWLPCDSAIAMPSESTDRLLPYTKSTAKDVGWQWEIPLQHRIGNGRVFSSSFMTADEAEQALIQDLPSKALGEPRQLRWKNGRRRKAWHKNCVAIGLSAGFLEPLESTGLQLIQAAILRLISLFPQHKCEQVDIDTFNRYADEEIEQIRDFIILHYKTSQRDDSDFWRYCKDMDIPDTLAAKIELYESSGRIFRDNNELFNEISWFSVMHGQGLKAKGYHPMADFLEQDKLKGYLQGINTAIETARSQMPDHRTFISTHCKAK